MTGLVFLTDNVTEISPVRALVGLKLLTCVGSGTGLGKLADLSPLKGMPLKRLSCDFKPERDTELLRSIKTLEMINDKPAEEFWKEVEAGNTGKKATINTPSDPAFLKWMKQVATLLPEKQVEAVAKKLQELNPGFDGKVTPYIDNGVVKSLNLIADNVNDISPVRALLQLQAFNCSGSASGNGRLADLSPIKGLMLQSLDCAYTNISDLSPLKGMGLERLQCIGTPVADLSPLKGMPLTHLYIGTTKVSELLPLKGMRLQDLNIGGTQVSDLSPLQGMPLTSLGLSDNRVADLTPLTGMQLVLFTCLNTQVADLSPLKGMPLTHLDFRSTQVTNISNLRSMPLKELHLDFNPDRDTEILRSIKGLESINGKPVAEFWNEVEEQTKK